MARGNRRKSGQDKTPKKSPPKHPADDPTSPEAADPTSKDAAINNPTNLDPVKADGAPIDTEVHNQGEDIEFPLSMASIRICINDAITQIRSDINCRIDTLESNLIKKYDDLNTSLTTKINTLSETVSKHDVTIKQHDETIKNLTKVNQQLQTQVNEAMKMANDAQQYSRRWLIRVFNVSESPEENCTDKVVGLVNTHVRPDLPLRREELEAAHRVGPPRRPSQPGETPTPRPIIVRFHSRARKFDVLEHRRRLKVTPFSIAEDMTKMNVTLLNRLNNAPAEIISSCWFTNGKVKAQQAVTKKIAVVGLFDKIQDCFK